MSPVAVKKLKSTVEVNDNYTAKDIPLIQQFQVDSLACSCVNGNSSKEREETLNEDGDCISMFTRVVRWRRGEGDTKLSIEELAACASLRMPGVHQVVGSLILTREAENPNDKNAIILSGKEENSGTGYIPREIAKILAPLLDSSIVKVTPIADIAPSHRILLHIERMQEPEDSRLRETLKRLVIFAKESEDRGSGGYWGEVASNMMQQVKAHQKHLLSEEEGRIVEKLSKMGKQELSLLSHLMMRKADPARWDAKEKVRGYQDVPDPEKSLKIIQELGFLKEFNLESSKLPEKLFESLTKKQMTSIAKELKWRIKSSLHSAEYYRKMHRLLFKQRTFWGGVPATTKKVVKKIAKLLGPYFTFKPDIVEAFFKAQALFFHGDATIATLSNEQRGVMIYYPYKVSNDSIFLSQESFNLWYDGLKARLEFDHVVESEKIDLDDIQSFVDRAMSLRETWGKYPRENSWVDRFHPSRHWASILGESVKILEKDKKHAFASEILQFLLNNYPNSGRRGKWWTRLAINYTSHLKLKDRALEFCQEALKDSKVIGGDRLGFERRVEKLSSKKSSKKKKDSDLQDEWMSHTIIARPTSMVVGRKSLFYSESNECGSVEELVAEHYEAQGWKGCHCEGAIFRILYGLLMIDVIYSPVEKVWQHRCQRSPLDFGTPDFYSNRCDVINAALEEIRDMSREELSSRVDKVWSEQNGRNICLVNWDRWCLDELLEMTQSIGGPALSVVFRKFSEDYGYWGGGLPDLFLWRTDFKENEPGSMLVEVKGPRDTLSERQRAWLCYLHKDAAEQMPVYVCHVKEPKTPN